MRRLLRFLGIVAGVLVGLAVLGGGLLAVEIWSRKPLKTVPSTTHASITPQACIDCHAPIAEEWRQSFHYRSLTGPYWNDVREMGYLKVFDATRKACVNCHAPANVLDLAETVPAAASGNEPLGVECTPNLLREPGGTIPSARADDVELGVDCTSCHVSKRGIVGAGRHPTAAHETVADRRFQEPALAADTLCRTCHRATSRGLEENEVRLCGRHLPGLPHAFNERRVGRRGPRAPATKSQVLGRQGSSHAGEGRERLPDDNRRAQGALPHHQ